MNEQKSHSHSHQFQVLTSNNNSCNTCVNLDRMFSRSEFWHVYMTVIELGFTKGISFLKFEITIADKWG